MPRSGPPAWMKSTSWRAGSDKPAKPPCPYLVNEQECSRGGYCRHNHDPARVRDWIRVRKAIPCIEFFAEGHCVRGSLCMYGHDFARRQRETAQRKDGLTHVFCAISLSGNTDVGGAIELTKATELASYNWLDSPEHAIAVPGVPFSQLGSLWGLTNNRLSQALPARPRPQSRTGRRRLPRRTGGTMGAARIRSHDAIHLHHGTGL